MTLVQQHACASRELELRKRVYPRWVKEGKMTQQKAWHEINCMTAIVETLTKMRDLEEVSQQMLLSKTTTTEQPSETPPPNKVDVQG